MALNFLITSTDARVGKTMVGCALAFAFKVRGMRVGVMKPVETGCGFIDQSPGALVATDGAALIASASSDLPLELVSPFRYRSAIAPAAEADGASPPSFAAIVRAYREIAACSNVTLVEDCGGLAAPIEEERNYADLARELALDIVLVVANRGSFTNASVLALDYAARRGIPVRGFILNALDRDASASVDRDAEAVARATGARSLGTVRFKEPLGLAIVESLL
jgi:dethiobiotin synthetase